MQYARDVKNGEIVAAEDASRRRVYVCPRPGCGGNVYLPRVVVQRPHFRHNPGEGTTACDEYFPGSGLVDDDLLAITAVEEDPHELGLLITRLDGHWGLGLRLPEIPSEELGEASLIALSSAFVSVYSGQDRLLKVSALELRPGVGSARVDVTPSLLGYRTEPGGSWPASIDKGRWRLESRGFEVKGALFRVRMGEWTRLLAGSQVHYGENLLLLADKYCVPPESTIIDSHALKSNSGTHWIIWELRLPSEPEVNVAGWLARLGHDFVERQWSIGLVTPPRTYTEHGEPAFWVGDSPVLKLESPQGTSVARIAVQSGSNCQFAELRATDGQFACFSVSLSNVGLAQLAVVGQLNASLDIAFIEFPSPAMVRELLLKTARLRIQIGDQTLEAWEANTHKVHLPSHQQPLVRVDLGDASVRARVTVFERGLQCTKRGLDSSGVAKAIENVIASAERIEVDADNLGRIVFLPVRTVVDANGNVNSSGRLVWREYIVSLCSSGEERLAPILLSQSGGRSKSLAIRQVVPASLVYSRMALRRRHDSRGSR